MPSAVSPLTPAWSGSDDCIKGVWVSETQITQTGRGQGNTEREGNATMRGG
eukprot:COSAG03_NODE_7_length_25331_cov_113.442375_3_plen_51_part_00